MVDLIGLEDRESDTPPCDSLAEGIVLRHLLLGPWLIDTRDVGPLLVFPEHRLLLTAMRRAARTHAVDPETHAGWGEFFLAWVNELEELRPGDGWRLAELLDWTAEAESRWISARCEDDRERGIEPVLRSRHMHDWLWWVRRLEEVQATRADLVDAQEMAECSWRGDADGARRAALRASLRLMPNVVPPDPIRTDFTDLAV